MSEERTQYTVHPDVAIRLQVSEAHIKQLTSTIDGMTMVMGRHADTITAQRERIAELEKDLEIWKNIAFGQGSQIVHTPMNAVRRYFQYTAVMPEWKDEYGSAYIEDSAAIDKWLQTPPDLSIVGETENRHIAELEATIARLEADNRRLRHLDAMPLDAMRRHFRFSMYAETVALEAEYTAQQFDADDAEIYHWLFPQDGDA